MDKQRIYDEIISVSITNAGAERQRNSICLIREFNPNDPRHMLYYEASLIYCSVIDEPLYLNMPWYKYVWFLLHHWKSRKQLKFLSKWELIDRELSKEDDNFAIADADVLVEHICRWAKETYGISEDEFNRIYEEVYQSGRNDN